MTQIDQSKHCFLIRILIGVHFNRLNENQLTTRSQNVPGHMLGSFSGSEVTFASSITMSAFLSMTCVAPRDLTRSPLCKEQVVMIGENPDILAN